MGTGTPAGKIPISGAQNAAAKGADIEPGPVDRCHDRNSGPLGGHPRLRNRLGRELVANAARPAQALEIWAVTVIDSGEAKPACARDLGREAQGVLPKGSKG